MGHFFCVNIAGKNVGKAHDAASYWSISQKESKIETLEFKKVAFFFGFI